MDRAASCPPALVSGKYETSQQDRSSRVPNGTQSMPQGERHAERATRGTSCGQLIARIAAEEFDFGYLMRSICEHLRVNLDGVLGMRAGRAGHLSCQDSRHNGTRSLWLPAFAVVLVLTSCGENSNPSAANSNTSAATWVVDPNEQVTSATTNFMVVVTRVGCGSGVDGEPEAPVVEYSESEVRVTFQISPRIDSGTCEGTLGVPYEVALTEPLGDRPIVDGECHPGSTAWATAFCLDEGVRYSNG